MLTHAFEDFFHYLQIERGLSENTLKSYRRDLKQYQLYIEKVTQKHTWEDVTRTDITGFLHMLKDDGKSAATIARNTSTIRLFHQFLIREKIISHDPSLHIETPLKDSKIPDVLFSKEIDKLLNLNHTNTMT